jgi:hypothetical protein
MEEERHLYRGKSGESSRSEIVHRYEREGESPERAEESYGRIVGKVAREQAAKSPSGTKLEHIRGHIAFSDEGRRFEVRAHDAHVHAERHARGHHGGPCDAACRKGLVEHRHKRRRR